MRINLTSVEETEHLEQIQKMIKSIFPKYTVTVIPNKYATEKGKAEVKAYIKKYNEEHREEINRKRRERYAKQKETKQNHDKKSKKEKGEVTKVKKKPKRKFLLENEGNVKDFAEYIITREYELNEKKDDKQFCKKYCERYYR